MGRVDAVYSDVVSDRRLTFISRLLNKVWGWVLGRAKPNLAGYPISSDFT